MSSPTGEVLKVFMVTYNHEAFIREAVESVMMQRTDFPVVLVIGEDKSTDNTRAIVQELAAEYPGRIEPILHETNLGAARTGLDVWEACLRDSTYVAILEGDDFWTDPEKLQRQVDVLRADPSVSMCFHDAWNQAPDGTRTEYVRAWLGKRPVKERFGLDDVITENFVPTVSICLRNTPELRLLERLSGHPLMDHTINVVLGGLGQLAYIDRPMGVRRQHAGGLISMRGRQHKIDFNLDLLPHLNALTSGRYADRLARRRKELLDMAFQAAVSAGDRPTVRQRWRRIWRERGEAGYSARELARIFTIAHFPALAGRIAHARMAR